MPELKPTRKNAKGQGRKPLPTKVKKTNRLETKKKYVKTKKSLTILFEPENFEALKKAKLEANLSYQELILNLLNESSKTAKK